MYASFTPNKLIYIQFCILGDEDKKILLDEYYSSLLQYEPKILLEAIKRRFPSVEIMQESSSGYGSSSGSLKDDFNEEKKPIPQMLAIYNTQQQQQQQQQQQLVRPQLQRPFFPAGEFMNNVASNIDIGWAGGSNNQCNEVSSAGSNENGALSQADGRMMETHASDWPMGPSGGTQAQNGGIRMDGNRSGFTQANNRTDEQSKAEEEEVQEQGEERYIGRNVCIFKSISNSSIQFNLKLE